jgi:AraC family transcriptional regulator of adaptative response / DNA-3-methyladenine glycosylase II
VIEVAWTGSALLGRTWTEAVDQSTAAGVISRLCDAQAAAPVIDDHLACDPALGPLVAARPGLRVPGAVDPHELAFRALIGQQISLAAAAICAAKLADHYGELVDSADSRLHRLLPDAAALAAVDPVELPMPRARGRALVGLARVLADGTLDVLSEQPWSQRRAALLAVPGIGPWTADYVGLRALGRPDILLDTDLVIKRELALLGIGETARWAPWRSYATMHLWQGYFDRGSAVG